MTRKDIKISLIELEKKQVDLIPELELRGIKTVPTELCTALSEEVHPPKRQAIWDATEQIISEWKQAAQI